MSGPEVDLTLLKEDLEKLVLLEEVAERRQQMIEKRLEEAIEAGVPAETIRKELNLSQESLRRILRDDPPELAERLGVSEETAGNIAEPIP